MTIPPVGWINAGHRHGVPVLGTFITEWELGAEYCRYLFGTQAAAELTAVRLAAVARSYGFDGWVVNIENDLDPDHVPNVICFLRLLRGLLRSANASSEVVWYDAVTKDGSLKWQNTLNDMNRPFFEAATSLWINYTWKESTPQEVRAQAGERCHDVFMGIDVFGRGTYGGGGHTCDVALAAAKKEGLSAALFAIGWPYEADPQPQDPVLWEERDAAFWALVTRSWTPQWPICTQLPLHTDFSVGCGRFTMHEGTAVSFAPWYNMSRQGLQPALLVSRFDDRQDWLVRTGTRAAAVQEDSPLKSTLPSQPTLHAAPTLQVGYNSGSSVEITSTPGFEGGLVHLFQVAIPVPSAGLTVDCVWAGGDSLHLLLLLTLQSNSSQGNGLCSSQGAATSKELLLACCQNAGVQEQWFFSHLTDKCHPPAVLVLPMEADNAARLRNEPKNIPPFMSSVEPQHHEYIWVRQRYIINMLHIADGIGPWVITSIDVAVFPIENAFHASHTCRVLLGELVLQANQPQILTY